jgi:subtilase family serine protease
MFGLQRAAAALTAAGVITALSAGGATAAVPRARVGSVPRLPAAAHVSGAVPPGRSVTLELVLTSRDPVGLTRMATAVATPSSPRFHHYLSVAGFARRFGAPAARIAEVERTLRAGGLQVGPVDPNHLTLSVHGPARAVQRAFATRLAAVRLSDGRRAYADRRAPTLPASVAGDVSAVVGLNSLVRPQSDEQAGALRPAAGADATRPATARAGHALRGPQVVTGGPQPCAGALSAAADPRLGGYTADEIAAAYGFSGLYGLGDSGAGQTIAVYELEKVDPADITAYQRCYGTHAPVSYVNVGRPQATGEDAESALDVEQIVGLAPGARVLVYQANDTAAAGVQEYRQIITEDRAQTVSISWGACEAKLTLDGSDLSIVKMEDALFQEAAVQGQSVLAASGDTGSAACVRDLDSRALAVQDPSSQPYVTGVGGTALYADPAGHPGLWNPAVATAPLLEAVWNDRMFKTTEGRQPAASTGGLSRLWAMPSYQRAANPGLGVINGHSSGRPCGAGQCREIPDVAADGDPAFGYVVHVSVGSRTGWTTEGGTSAAAPVWAALTALTDALPACRGASLGFENPALYELAAAAPTDFRDITAADPLTGAGDNDAVGVNHGLFPVTAGYDMTTGLGVPNAPALAAGLCSLRAPVYTVAIAAPPAQTVAAGAPFRLALTATDSGRLPLTFHATGLPPGLSISRRGVIGGIAETPGTYTVTVTAADRASNRAATSFVLTVLPPRATASAATLQDVAGARPALAFTATATSSTRLHVITVGLPAGLSLTGATRGIAVTAGGRPVAAAIRAGHGSTTMTVTLARPATAVRVALGPPALAGAPGLRRTARRHPRTTVAVSVGLVDTGRQTTRQTLHLRLGG